MSADWPTWSPPHAPHVVARIEPRAWDSAEKKHQPQTVLLSCARCGDRHRVVCESGRPREHALVYAKVHLHEDPLPSPKPAS